MIKSFRKRPRPDTLKTEQRRVTNRTGRIFYFCLLLAMLVSGANYIFGDFVFLRADGVVLRDESAVSTTYLARVEAVEVKPGDAVTDGEVVLRLQSMDVLERIADLSARNASLTAKAAEFKIRSDTINVVLPLAARRESETANVLDRLDGLSNVNLVTATRYSDALRARFDAQLEHARFEAENRVLTGQIEALDAARADAAAALADLRVHYASGIMRAPRGGAIGATVPSVGDVYKPGEKILSIYSGAAHVLAYLPSHYLFTISPGTRVLVKSGRAYATGEITQILPVTEALPEEFQNSFRPRDRNQLARIRFDEPPPFPLHEKVTITSNMDIIWRLFGSN